MRIIKGVLKTTLVLKPLLVTTHLHVLVTTSIYLNTHPSETEPLLLPCSDGSSDTCGSATTRSWPTVRRAHAERTPRGRRFTYLFEYNTVYRDTAMSLWSHIHLYQCVHVCMYVCMHVSSCVRAETLTILQSVFCGHHHGHDCGGTAQPKCMQKQWGNHLRGVGRKMQC